MQIQFDRGVILHVMKEVPKEGIKPKTPDIGKPYTRLSEFKARNSGENLRPPSLLQRIRNLLAPLFPGL